MEDIRVVALNGFTRRDTTEGLCGFVRTVLTHEPGPPALSTHYGMGGGGLHAFRRMSAKVERWLREDESEGICRRYTFIGHSYGAHWCRRLLWRLERKRLLHLCDPYLVAVDPQYVLHRLSRQERRVPDRVAGACVRQAGGMGGYALAGGVGLTNTTLHDADHSGIVYHPQTRYEVRWGLRRY